MDICSFYVNKSDEISKIPADIEKNCIANTEVHIIYIFIYEKK